MRGLPTKMIPERFKNVKYEDVPEQIRKLFEAIPQTRQGIYIHGPVGSGKTHIVYALSEKWHIESTPENGYHGRSARFWNVTELLDKVRSQFDRKEPDDILDDLKEYKGILILDDIGAEKITDWVRERFYTLINRRYEDLKVTIFTSNKTISELSDHIGDRTTSRIVEMCNIVELVGSDRRITDKPITKVKI